MRRTIGVILAAVLAFAPLVCAAASYNLGPVVFRGLFGETRDIGASAAQASAGWAESPLRGVAFAHVLWPRDSARANAGRSLLAFASFPRMGDTGAAASNLTSILGAQLAPTGVGFALPTQPAVRLTLPRIAVPSAVTGAYVATAVSVSPPPLDTVDLDPSHLVSAIASGSRRDTLVVPVSLHVGRLALQGNLREGQTGTQAPRLGVSDRGYGAGADFAVRAGSRHVAINVSSSYEHLMHDDTIAYAPAPLDPSWSLAGDTLPLGQNYANVNKLALGADVAVPVTQALTLNLNYRAQRFVGGYELPGLANLDATDSWYGGGVTYTIPRWSSQISLSARQYHYQDNLLPANTFSDTRANLNFTVKF